MLHILELGITKLLIKPAKDKDKERRKEREAAIYYKIISPKALVDWEQWKVPISRECI